MYQRTLQCSCPWLVGPFRRRSLSSTCDRKWNSSWFLFFCMCVCSPCWRKWEFEHIRLFVSCSFICPTAFVFLTQSFCFSLSCSSSPCFRLSSQLVWLDIKASGRCAGRPKCLLTRRTSDQLIQNQDANLTFSSSSQDFSLILFRWIWNAVFSGTLQRNWCSWLVIKDDKASFVHQRFLSIRRGDVWSDEVVN